MRIRHLAISNFRGIREMGWALPDKAFFCLIGRGDSTKSTILEALRRIFYPQWNLVFDDADFYECKPENTIRLEAVLGCIPEEFRDLENYGHCLSGWNPENLRSHSDPGEGLEDVLRIRLAVGADLEPAWRVIKSDDDEGVRFKTNDRAKAAVSLIGAASDRHLTWSRGSLLNQLTETDSISSSLAEAGRAAKAAMEAHRNESLTKFDQVAKTVEATAKTLGVNVASSYKAQLDSDAINVRIAGLAIHDGDMPLRQLGLGSKRMLTTGLQKNSLRVPHITLFDEVEIGLEPHRIARLLHHLKQDKDGQYLLTTHSPVVLRELTVDELYIVHSGGGKTEIVAANKPAIADSIQGKIRLGAEAFLAPKIVVCEGATEAGFLRGLDNHWVSKGKNSFAYQGVALFDANGASKITEIADGLKGLCYNVSVLADSDNPQQFSDAHADELRAKGLIVTVWGGGVSIERRVFADVPWASVMASFEVACLIHGDREKILNQIQSQYGQAFDRNYAEWTDGPALREALGKAADASEWYKRQSWAQLWADAITSHLDEIAFQDTDLSRRIRSIREWIDHA
jgi:ABC-type branched-subunit amino acid transport system ATPase component